MVSPADEFQSLLNQREMAAFRGMTILKTVRDFWEAQDFDSAKAAIDRALSDYEAADRKVSQFRQTHKGASPNGNRTAAA